jgi:hypothetical protein
MGRHRRDTDTTPERSWNSAIRRGGHRSRAGHGCCFHDYRRHKCHGPGWSLTTRRPLRIPVHGLILATHHAWGGERVSGVRLCRERRCRIQKCRGWSSSATGDSSRRASDCRKVRQNRPSVVAGLPLAPTRNVQRSIGKTSRGDLIDETAVNDQQCHPHASGPVRVGVPRAVPGARRSHHAHHTRGRGADPLWRVRRNRRDLPLEAGGSRMWIGPGIGRGVARRRRTRWEPLRHAHGLIPPRAAHAIRVSLDRPPAAGTYSRNV